MNSNVIYVNKEGYVIARINRKHPYIVYRAKYLPDKCADVISSIFDTRLQAEDWKGVFNVDDKWKGIG